MHLSRTPVPALQVGNPPFPEKAHHSAKPTHRDQSSLPTVRTRATRPRVLDALHGTCTDTRPCLSYAGLRFAPYVSHLQHSRVRNYFHMPCVQMHCSARSHSALLHRGRYSFAQCPFAQKEVLFRIVPFCTERGTLSYSALLHRQRYSFTVSKFPNRYYRLFTPSQPCRTHLFTRPSQYALVHKEVRLTHISSTIWS